MKFSYSASLIEPVDIEKAAKSMSSYVSHLKGVVASGSYDAAESTINLPSDEALLKNVLIMKEKKAPRAPKYIIDIGIGGSNLGTKAVYDAFYGYFDVFSLSRPNTSKIIFLDTNDEEFLSKMVQFIGQLESKEDVLINAISKSGGTTETIANLEIVLAAMNATFGDSKDRLVITTDEGSALWNEAKKQGIDVLGIPKQVGGRFSVLSAVGMFPLAAAGIDIQKIRAGAVTMREAGLNEDVMKNPSLLSAVVLYLSNKHGKNINDNFFFLPQLESLGKWYRQLMGESVGKENDLDGNAAHTGITPTVSIGSTDLHSVGQLYLGGPKDKITTFVSAETPNAEARVPETLTFPLVPSIEGKRASTIMFAIKEGTKFAYTKQAQPYMEVQLESLNETTLGEYLQFKMTEMMYLGKLFNVNTFDQPHVELYKG